MQQGLNIIPKQSVYRKENKQESQNQNKMHKQNQENENCPESSRDQIKDLKMNKEMAMIWKFAENIQHELDLICKLLKNDNTIEPSNPDEANAEVL